MGKSPLDLNKYFVEEYFNKNVFRVFILLMIFLLIFTYYSNDWNYKFEYACCPEGGEDCLFYDGIKYNEFDRFNTVNKYDVLPSGACVGNPPNIHALNFNKRIGILIIISLLINHLFFIIKYKKLIPKNNKKEVDKLKKIIDPEGGKNEER